MATLLIDEILHILECKKEELEIKLSIPQNRGKINRRLNNCLLRTLYRNRNNTRQIINFDHITARSAKELKAYNRFLSVTMIQHLYIRHRVKLGHPNLPCIVQVQGSMKKFFPIETLEIIDKRYLINKEKLESRRQRFIQTDHNCLFLDIMKMVI
jgi:hypothetical protein